jgi:hypothetical protein
LEIESKGACHHLPLILGGANKSFHRTTFTMFGGEVMVEKHHFYRNLSFSFLAKPVVLLGANAIGVYLKKYT